MNKREIMIRGTEIIDILRQNNIEGLDDVERQNMLSSLEHMRSEYQLYVSKNLTNWAILGFFSFCLGLFFFSSGCTMDKAYFETGMNMGKYADSTSYEYRSSQSMNSSIFMAYAFGLALIAFPFLQYFIWPKRYVSDFEKLVLEFDTKYSNAKRTALNIAKYEIVVDAPETVNYTESKSELSIDFSQKKQALEELFQLKNDGALTEEEYLEEKKKILSK